MELPQQGAARATDPTTSHDAAARVDAKGLGLRVLEELRAHGAGTAHEVAQRMNASLVTISPRMKPLEGASLIRRAGRRDGRTVWEAIPQ